jgi:chorismate mutase
MDWLSNADPRVIQGTLTLGSAVLGALTALWIAYRAYPKQKRRDRELQVHLEKRAAYSNFFRASSKYYAAMMSRDPERIEETSERLREELNGLFFYASPEILHEAKALMTALLFWEIVRRREFEVEKSDEEVEAHFQELAEAYMDHEQVALALARSEILGLKWGQADSEIAFEDDVGYLRLRRHSSEVQGSVKGKAEET